MGGLLRWTPFLWNKRPKYQILFFFPSLQNSSSTCWWGEKIKIHILTNLQTKSVLNAPAWVPHLCNSDDNMHILLLRALQKVPTKWNLKITLLQNIVLKFIHTFFCNILMKFLKRLYVDTDIICNNHYSHTPHPHCKLSRIENWERYFMCSAAMDNFSSYCWEIKVEPQLNFHIDFTFVQLPHKSIDMCNIFNSL